MAAIIGNVIGILICGGLGGVGAWALVTAVGLSGIVGAIVAAFAGVALATALWVAGSSLLRALGGSR